MLLNFHFSIPVKAPKSRIMIFISTFIHLSRTSKFQFPIKGPPQKQLANSLLFHCRANMIGDVARTGTYRKAILGNAGVAFAGKTVLDVGAGEFFSSSLSKVMGEMLMHVGT